ncbi:efflux transporter, RND family, MFP subunit [Chlorobium phaeobacteroides DSM 266]|uniref:Efflux transporter, RND family, MFP subunit n=2 Tax=Chlorobium phaeobacteroides TaxID=1096 RepID=A1BFB4_CHLPD|nr:efflux transporter, RND family, MFP subunit [Chlorobium phaeobacteroides DSM 266]
MFEIMKRKRIRIALLLLAVVSLLFWWMQSGHKSDKMESGYSGNFPVMAEIVRVASVRDSFGVTGSVQALRDVEVFSETSGIVRKAYVEVGEKKQAGAVLFQVDDELQASAERKARLACIQAKRDYERYANLYQEGAVALGSVEPLKLKLDDAEADLITAGRKYRDTKIKMPVSGTVTARFVEEGEMVQPGVKVANVVDLSQLKIRFYLSEKQVLMVSSGSLIKITSDLYPGRIFAATLFSLSGKAGRDHTFEAEARMENPQATPFRSGMFVRVSASGAAERQSVVIPRAALAGSILNPQVFVVNLGTARVRNIVAGSSYGTSIEVLSGLVPGDSVVTSGQNELHDGMQVSVLRQTGKGPEK